MQSVDRALTVLEILAGRGVAGVTEIAGELGVHKSTASRLIAVLESRGFVEQLSDRGKYRLGFGIARLAGALTVHRDLAHAGRAASEALAAELGETVNLAIPDGSRVINISEVRGPGALAVQNWVGQSTPSHATSSGKVLLADLAQPDREALLGADLERYTEHTITDLGVLARELDAVRERGWASTVEEYELGLNAVAAPVRDHDGTVVAAISVAGPSFRLVREDFPKVAARVLQAAEEFEHRLGNFS
ncbi:MAG TPA: IclR family transcriptional regulator [Mycobacteriales bacterium]|nr:IclR family transcriptional regulator [Mycobacteriales bacterium]